MSTLPSDAQAFLLDLLNTPSPTGLADRAIAYTEQALAALPGIELCHNGLNAPNLYTREIPLAPHHLPVATYGFDPVQARMMTKQDLADLRRWHRNAVLRAIRAGYDLLYVYAGRSTNCLSLSVNANGHLPDAVAVNIPDAEGEGSTREVVYPDQTELGTRFSNGAATDLFLIKLSLLIS